MSGSLLILAFFGAGLGLARLGLIPRYFVEHDATLYVLWLLMGLVGLSIGSDRRLGEILRTLRPRVLLLPLATTVGTFAGVAAASLFLAYSLADCLAVGAGFAYYSLSSIFITQYKGAELGTVALLSNILREILTLVGTPPNGIINSMLAQTGQTPFGFFEFGLIGIPLLVVGLAYYGLIGHRFLPEGRQMDDDIVTEGQTRRENKMWYSIAIFAFVVFMMASELMPLTTAAILGACLMVISGCMTMREAFRSVDWTTIFLFAGMLSMSAAMAKSGAAAIVANAVVSMVSDPWMLMLVCCALTALITNFMSNTATAALMAPLALPIALASGISPLPITMGIAMSASACFLTPIATPPNTIVLGPGKYSFLDYVKAGWPLQLITLLMCWLLIPMIWPFHP